MNAGRSLAVDSGPLLNAVTLPLSEMKRNNPTLRIDSSYFSVTAIAADAKLRRRSFSLLRDVASSIESFGAYALTNNFTYQESGVPYLRCTNIKKGFISFADTLYISEEANALLPKSEVQPETLLLTMSGSVGKCRGCVTRVAVPDKF